MDILEDLRGHYRGVRQRIEMAARDAERRRREREEMLRNDDLQRQIDHRKAEDERIRRMIEVSGVREMAPLNRAERMASEIATRHGVTLAQVRARATGRRAPAVARNAIIVELRDAGISFHVITKTVDRSRAAIVEMYRKIKLREERANGHGYGHQFDVERADGPALEFGPERV